MKAFAELTKDCLELAPAERMKLARVLLEATDYDPASLTNADAAWEEEIQARIQAVDGGTARGVPYEEVRRLAQERLAE